MFKWLWSSRVVRGQLPHQDRYANWWPFSSAFVRNPTQINLKAFSFSCADGFDAACFFSKSYTIASYLFSFHTAKRLAQQIRIKHNANDCSTMFFYWHRSILSTVNTGCCLRSIELAVGSTITCISAVCLCVGLSRSDVRYNLTLNRCESPIECSSTQHSFFSSSFDLSIIIFFCMRMWKRRRRLRRRTLLRMYFCWHFRNASIIWQV